MAKMVLNKMFELFMTSGMDIHIHGDVEGNIIAAGEFVLYTSASLFVDIKAAGIRVKNE